MPIPLETARRLCAEIRAVRARKLFSQRWGCVRASKGVEGRMCFHTVSKAYANLPFDTLQSCTLPYLRNFLEPPDFRGCAQVNERYDAGK